MPAGDTIRVWRLSEIASAAAAAAAVIARTDDVTIVGHMYNFSSQCTRADAAEIKPSVVLTNKTKIVLTNKT